MPGPALLLLALLVAAHAQPAAAREPEPADRYAACLTLAREAPEQAFEDATAWEGLDGGEPARHCIALALLGMGQAEEAARRLEHLATDSRRAPDLRAGLLAQAGQAWMQAGEYARAHAAQTTAITLAPDDPELYVYRAQALAGAENWWEAMDDLNRALDLAPGLTEALVFRASAWRHLDADDLALEDVEEALALDPDNPAALLERGNLRRIMGDDDGARSDWLAVLRLDPQGPAGEAARANIEAMDVRDR